MREGKTQESNGRRQPCPSQTAGGSQIHLLQTEPAQDRVFPLFIPFCISSVPHDKNQINKHRGAQLHSQSLAWHEEADAWKGKADKRDKAGTWGFQNVQVSAAAGWQEDPESCCKFLFLGRRHWRPRTWEQSVRERAEDQGRRPRHSAVSHPFLIRAQGTHHKAEKHPAVCVFWSPAPPRRPWWMVLCAGRMRCRNSRGCGTTPRCQTCLHHDRREETSSTSSSSTPKHLFHPPWSWQGWKVRGQAASAQPHCPNHPTAPPHQPFL